MEPGDLILTPSWYWHGHISKDAEPMIWMDGLDLPLVHALCAKFHEEAGGMNPPALEQPDDSSLRYGSGWLLPIGERGESHISPMMKYPWSKAHERLMLMTNHRGSPFDGLALQYTNPFSGGPVMPTIDCWIQSLRPREHTKAHRHTGSAVYNVVRGTGFSVINGRRFDWSPGDIFCIPPWSWHEHSNPSDSEPAMLFSMNDAPVFKALGLYREQSYESGEGRQAIASVF
jgi:gentisate 1,2-dioxygenase